MRRYALSHLSDPTLLRGFATMVSRDCMTTADLLAYLAEIDHRKLYLGAAYPSMFAFCVSEHGFSEDVAANRIRAARTARRFPMIFGMVAERQLHLSAVNLLAPHLREENAQELLSAATHKSKAELERLLAQRFPRTDVLALVTEVASTPQHAPGCVDDPCPRTVRAEPAPSQHAPGRVGNGVKPLSAQSVMVQLTLSAQEHDRLRYAQELLGHEIPSGDLAQVVVRALEALIPQLERRKFARAERPRAQQPRRKGASRRYVPAEVRRSVWKRDGGQCTFMSEGGRRCPARTRLEFDHVTEVARGGEATVSGIRLRCRAHNQYGAERSFGVEFMRHKRMAATEARATAAQQRASRARDQAAEQCTAWTREQAVARDPAPASVAGRAEERDVVPWLRSLGFNVSEARRAAALCDGMPNASLEERVRVALSYFRLRGTIRAGA